MTPLLITMLGQEDTGTIEELLSTVAEHSAIWRDSQFTRINGHLSGMGLLEVRDESMAPLMAALQELHGMQVATTVTPPVGPGIPRVMQLHVLGPDSGTTARDLLAGLTELGLDPRELRTHQHEVDGEPYFGATMMMADRTPGRVGLSEQVVTLAKRLGLHADVESIFAGAE